MKPSRLPPFLRSFGFALRGIRDFLSMGRNARIQAVVAVAVVIAGVWTGLSSGEWMTLVLCCGLVLAAEAFNTALEELANEVTEERRPRIRRAKDMAAGAVLITAMTAAIVGCVIFLPKWF